jgi:glycosyltransferase involved in cell wall biosynthesis
MMRARSTANSEQAMKTMEMLSGIRIARVSTVPFFVLAQLKHQIVTLGEQGAKVTVIASDEPELSLLKGLTGVSCRAIDIPRSISLWRDLRALYFLLCFFRRERIQIAHSTTPKAGLITALAAYIAGVPVRLHTFTGQPWITMRGAKRWVARTSDKLIGRLNTRCYTDSASQRRFLISQGIMVERKLFVIGTGSLAGVDLKRFDRNRFSANQLEDMRQSLGIARDAPVLLFVGRITVDKGVRELLQAFAIVKASICNAHLVFVGKVDTESGVAGAISPKDIERVADTHMVGHTECPEAYMALADVLCLPSYREGFGTVVIEAAAMGVPTVGTDIYGLSDAIEHGETGLLVPARNVEALANALRSLIADKLLRAQMGAAARQRVCAQFDAVEVNKQVIYEYRDLLKKQGILQ